jgi:hypothetical protein
VVVSAGVRSSEMHTKEALKMNKKPVKLEKTGFIGSYSSVALSTVLWC